MSTGPRRNVRTREFKASFDQLPERIRDLTVAAYRQFLRNLDHPALRRHPLRETHQGQHRPGSISVSINLQYRAIYVEDGGDNVWYWVGTHSQYNSFTGNG